MATLSSIATMPTTRSSILSTKLDAKDFEAAQTLIRFHYDMKGMTAKPIAAKPNRCEHTMSLRGRKTSSASTRPKRECAVYTPGMYAEEV